MSLLLKKRVEYCDCKKRKENFINRKAFGNIPAKKQQNPGAVFPGESSGFVFDQNQKFPYKSLENRPTAIFAADTMRRTRKITKMEKFGNGRMNIKRGF